MSAGCSAADPLLHTNAFDRGSLAYHLPSHKRFFKGGRVYALPWSGTAVVSAGSSSASPDPRPILADNSGICSSVATVPASACSHAGTGIGSISGSPNGNTTDIAN